MPKGSGFDKSGALPPGGSQGPRGREGGASDAASAGRSGGANGDAPLWSNFVTVIGLFCAAVGAILSLTFGLFLITTSANPYGALVGYLALPGLLIAGVVLIPLGILWKSWRVHRRDPRAPLTVRFPRVNFNDPRQRSAAKLVVLGTFVLVPLVGFSGYRAYEYTDSRAFCAETCHTVMHPESTAHKESPHAQVACTQCHMGSGTDWYVKSKLSGMPQVVAVLKDSFPRPIPPAISELRPTREACVQCHWDKKSFATQLKKIVRFASDERNSRREIDMLLKTGSYGAAARGEGIHTHMGLAERIEYVATDEGLQNIPWVRYVDDSGNKIVYRSDGQPGSAPVVGGSPRTFDCMDCHNRPAHKFRSPQDAVDMYLNSGKIDARLPFIKREAVAALVKQYPDLESAKAAIRESFLTFYRKNYAGLFETFAEPIERAISAVGDIQQQIFFPEMKVGWRTYPDNIGHLISPGCFRCHDGKHVSQAGEAIRFNCKLCHTFPNFAGDSAQGGPARDGEFVHSFSLEGAHARLQCVQCHDGGVSPLLTCTRCHAQGLPGGN